MKNLSKLMVIALVAVLVIGFAAGCKKTPTGNDPYTIDLSLLLKDADGKSNQGSTNLVSALVPWPVDFCTNEEYLDDGIFLGMTDVCGICPTCEGKTTVVMNPDPLEKTWADFALYLPEFPADINWAGFNRARVKVRYYYDDFVTFEPRNSAVMVSLIYDPDGDWRGPAEGPGPNTPLKAFNLTNGRRPGEEDAEEDELPYGSRDGASGISSERGSFMFLDKAPSIILFQNADSNVAYVEVTEITFFFIPF
ncbi:MAG: hypothetical protein LBU88_02765 [Treponema sp.]|jgi:hypothetical protein|nr:hypothetical protein [Treponema sp.]